MDLKLFLMAGLFRVCIPGWGSSAAGMCRAPGVQWSTASRRPASAVSLTDFPGPVGETVEDVFPVTLVVLLPQPPSF